MCLCGLIERLTYLREACEEKTEVKKMSNAERRVENFDEMYNVPSTKYKVRIRIRTGTLL